MSTPLEALPPEARSRLQSLLDEVLRVNQQFNLTAVRDPHEAWTRHIEDSLQGLATGLFDARAKMIDIGTGAGFPGLPLLIARPQLQVTLLEATRKKCDFLRGAAALLGLPATVLCERAETVGQDKRYRGNFDLATARAVGSLSEVCELALPLLKEGGHAVLWRGSQAPQEVEADANAVNKLGGAVEAALPYRLPAGEATFHIVVVRKVRLTPREYPRRVGLPKQKPL